MQLHRLDYDHRPCAKLATIAGYLSLFLPRLLSRDGPEYPASKGAPRAAPSASVDIVTCLAMAVVVRKARLAGMNDEVLAHAFTR